MFAREDIEDTGNTDLEKPNKTLLGTIFVTIKPGRSRDRLFQEREKRLW
jgi:hypothetical protein